MSGVSCSMGSGQHRTAPAGETQPGAHDGGVVQGETDGHIAVIGHGHSEAQELQKTSEKCIWARQPALGYGLDLALHILQQLGHCGREAEVREETGC